MVGPGIFETNPVDQIVWTTGKIKLAREYGAVVLLHLTPSGLILFPMNKESDQGHLPPGKPSGIFAFYQQSHK